MEELRETAKAIYRSGSPQVQDLAYKFFKAMDANGDGRVDRSEFLAFMRQQGYSQMCNPSFFTVLDHDGNGTLDFSEVMTLYYIIKSGRPICVSCGTFFSCVECFKNHSALSWNQARPTTFNGNMPVPRCIVCTNTNYPTYTNTSYPTYWNTSCPTYMNTSYPTYTYATHPPSPSPSPNFPNAIVPVASTMDKWMAALKAFEIGLSIGNIADTMCTTM